MGLLSRHQITVFAVAAVSVLPSRLDRASVREAYENASRWVAGILGLEHRDDPYGLSYYLDIGITADQQTRGLAELKRAITLTDSKQLASALQSYDRAAALLPNLGDWVNVFSASVAATQGDTASVTGRLERIDSILSTDWAWRSRVRAYRNANDPAMAKQLASAAAQLEGYPRRRSEAWRAVGEIQLAQGDTASAATSFTRAIDAWPGSDAALEAARLLTALPGLHPEHHLRIGRTYLRFGNFKRAVASLNSYLASGTAPPDSVAQVKLEIGRAYFSTRNYKEAETVLLQAAEAAAPIASSALYLAGRAQYRAGSDEEGQRTLTQLVQRHPDQLATAQALVLLGDISQDELQLEPAQDYFKRATLAAPGSEPAGLAHMRLSAMALSRNDFAGAAALLEDYRQKFSAGARHQQATYWLGRTQIAMGNSDAGRDQLRQARDLDPFSYYGQRAAELIQEPVARERLAADPSTSADDAQAVAAALLRFDLLRAVGWNEAANFELERMKVFFADRPAALYSLAEGLNQRNRTVAGIGIGRDLLRRDSGTWNRRLMRIVYPMPFKEQIEKAARAQGLDPYFVAALIRQESMFNPTALSSADARGLMQVMPSTGRRIARTLGIRKYKTEMLYTPEINLRIGSRFLADMVRTWGGRTDFVLAAYNAGPSRVERWRNFPEARDADLFLERIPFDETRDYVRVVQLNARIYEALYGSGEAAR